MQTVKVLVTDGNGTSYSTMTADVRDESRPFASGKHGFYAGGKIEIDGVRYQLTCSIVKIQPKPLALHP